MRERAEIGDEVGHLIGPVRGITPAVAVAASIGGHREKAGARGAERRGLPGMPRLPEAVGEQHRRRLGAAVAVGRQGQPSAAGEDAGRDGRGSDHTVEYGTGAVGGQALPQVGEWTAKSHGQRAVHSGDPPPQAFAGRGRPSSAEPAGGKALLASGKWRVLGWPRFLRPMSRTRLGVTRNRGEGAFGEAWP